MPVPNASWAASDASSWTGAGRVKVRRVPGTRRSRTASGTPSTIGPADPLTSWTAGTAERRGGPIIGVVANRLIVFVAAASIVLPTACSHASSPSPPLQPPLSGEFTPRRLSEPLPPPAEPAPARPVVVSPAGRLVAVGSAPEGIVADPVTRTVVVGVRNPDQLTV